MLEVNVTTVIGVGGVPEDVGNRDIDVVGAELPLMGDEFVEENSVVVTGTTAVAVDGIAVVTDTGGTVLGWVWLDVQAAESARTAIAAALVTMR